MTLALKAGGQYVVDPSRLVREMGARTLQLWRAYWEIDPQDGNRADRAAAQVASAVANSAGARKEGGGFFTPDDFVPYLRAQVEPEELARRELEREEAALSAYLDRASGHKAHAFEEQ